MTHVTFHFDGGGSHKGSPAGWGWAAGINGREIAQGCGGLPPGTTNNVAEYHALQMAATFAVVHDWRMEMGVDPARMRFEFIGDSDIVVRQVQGTYVIRAPHLIEKHAEVMRVLAPLDYSIAWMPRARNTRADALATAGRAIYRARLAEAQASLRRPNA